MLNNELIMVFLPSISFCLFALGGTQISDKIKGWKGWRRFILPFIYFLFCVFLVPWWQALLVMLTSIFVFSLGYGEKHPSYWYKSLVGISYGLISIPIGLSWWNLITAISFVGLFKLSNTKLTANIFIWKICEGLFGLLVGIQLAYVLMLKGIIW